MYKNGIRTTEFFKDHDKLHSGIITESQVREGVAINKKITINKGIIKNGILID